MIKKEMGSHQKDCCYENRGKHTPTLPSTESLQSKRNIAKQMEKRNIEKDMYQTGRYRLSIFLHEATK